MDALTKTRDFHEKLAFIEFEIGVRKTEATAKTAGKWQAFIRTKD